MTHPAEAARNHIMVALEACQTDPTLEPMLHGLITVLAKAQKRLFPAASLPTDSPGCVDMVKRAMDSLAQALQLLQDLQTDADAVEVATQSIAKALQELHPLLETAKSRTPTPGAYDSQHHASLNAINVDTMLSTSSAHQIFNGFSQDIKDGGIFIATFQPRPKGSDVLVNFKLPKNKTVSTGGVVHFVREYNPEFPDIAPGMGVKFTNLSESNKTAIEQFLESRNTMFYDE